MSGKERGRVALGVLLFLCEVGHLAFQSISAHVRLRISWLRGCVPGERERYGVGWVERE
jgi:hypothetical protein